jgi:hypothetical protein
MFAVIGTDFASHWISSFGMRSVGPLAGGMRLETPAQFPTICAMVRNDDSHCALSLSNRRVLRHASTAATMPMISSLPIFIGRPKV